MRKIMEIAAGSQLIQRVFNVGAIASGVAILLACERVNCGDPTSIGIGLLFTGVCSLVYCEML